MHGHVIDQGNKIGYDRISVKPDDFWYAASLYDLKKMAWKVMEQSSF